MSYSNPAAYQRFMGRWSARLAPSFIRFAGVEDGQRVLDVGCGTGSLSAALLLAGPAIQVLGVDPVPAYVAFARQAVGESRAEFQTSTVEELPFPEAAFDAVLACLVLQEVADPARALLEMVRVTRAGGRVAACQWDFEGGLPMQSIFWGGAEALVPAEVARRRARDNAKAGGTAAASRVLEPRRFARCEDSTPAACHALRLVRRLLAALPCRGDADVRLCGVP
jgi:ubiquinone/menaquinone biosynthesis C-methylase UbiE